MASNLSTIGFDDSKPEELEKLLMRLAESASARLTTPKGDYAIWRSRTGAEIWFHLAPQAEGAGTEREIVGLTPFFEGNSNVPLNVTEAVRRPGYGEMEGAFHAWVAPDEEGEGAYPMVFDAVDFAAMGARELPERWRARVCGFARELKVYADEEAFVVSQSEEPKLAGCAFLPVGMFAAIAGRNADAPAAEQVPSSHALIVGKVLAHKRLVNEATDRAFHWLSVQSLAATYDVLAEPDAVSGEIVEGAIVHAGCWLFGRAMT